MKKSARKNAKSEPVETSDSEVFSGKSQKRLLYRPKNETFRNREHLTPEEMEALIDASKTQGRYPLRDSTMILLAYRHGLRVTEAVRLQWSDINLKAPTIYIKRLKGSQSGVHPLGKDEVKALTKLKNQAESTRWIFENERGGLISADTARKIFARAGRVAGLNFPVHFHMARHSCGYYLANRGTDLLLIQAWLGHRDISNTVRYTALAPNRFEGLWD
ncbi:MAG TPA: tyrosine-type recombinase/integrase [Oculatellaceae cyanobacterium]